MARRQKSHTLLSVLAIWIPLVYSSFGILGALTAVSGWAIASDEIIRLGLRIMLPPLLISGGILLLFCFSGLLYVISALLRVQPFTPHERVSRGAG